MKVFTLYRYLSEESYDLSKETLTMIAMELAYNIYEQYNVYTSVEDRKRYISQINGAIDNINEFSGLELPHESINQWVNGDKK